MYHTRKILLLVSIISTFKNDQFPQSIRKNDFHSDEVYFYYRNKVIPYTNQSFLAITIIQKHMPVNKHVQKSAEECLYKS